MLPPFSVLHDSPMLPPNNAEHDAPAVSAKLKYEKMQLDILVGLRIMEHLGQSSSSTHATVHRPDNEVVHILNWVSLFIMPNSADGAYSDVAVALSAEGGAVTIHIASGPGGPPSKGELARVTLFLSILRRAFHDNLGPTLTNSSFLAPLVHKEFPRIIQELALVRSTDPDGLTLDRLSRVVSFWLQYRPEGERSGGFMIMATASRGNEGATAMLVRAFQDLMELPENTELQEITAEEEYTYLEPRMAACDLLIRSTFFDDLVNHRPYRLALEVLDGQPYFQN